MGEWYTKIWFINGVDNVNWPPYRDWKADVSSVSPSSEHHSLWRRANARNVSFSISVQWSIYIINSVDKPNFNDYYYSSSKCINLTNSNWVIWHNILTWLLAAQECLENISHFLEVGCADLMVIHNRPWVVLSNDASCSPLYILWCCPRGMNVFCWKSF